MTHYELRDDPDDLPIVKATLPEAERAAVKRSKRLQAQVLVYRVTDHGETYLGSVWA